jgi:hypothetical protein
LAELTSKPSGAEPVENKEGIGMKKCLLTYLVFGLCVPVFGQSPAQVVLTESGKVSPSGLGTAPAAGAAGPACGEQPACSPLALPCDQPAGCCACPHVWGRVEYLLGWVQGARVPPLVTASPPGTSVANAGVLGAPGTQVLFGGSRLDSDVRSGVRADVGTWLGCDCKLGVEAGFFYLGDDRQSFVAGSPDGSRIVARPFFDAVTGRPASQLVSFPGLVAGAVRADAVTNNVLGARALLRCRLCCADQCDCGYSVDLLSGYRFLAFDDALAVEETLRPLGPLFVPGSTLTVRDSFTANNRFHGVALGLGLRACRGDWSLEVSPVLDVGQMNREVSIFGQTTVAVPGLPPMVFPGGLLAQRTNIGTYRSDNWTVIPELDLRLGYRVARNVRMTVGYSLIYFTDLARAGDHVDLRVNPSLLPPALAAAGPAVPAFTPNRSDAWLQALTFGVEVWF